MYLNELVAILEQEDPNKEVEFGFSHPHSYRGFYKELGVEPTKHVTVGDMLKTLQGAIGHTYTGWKGGEFTMGEYSIVYLAFVGQTGEELGPRLLKFMLGLPQDDWESSRWT